jgi:hypothetical protein
MPEAIVAVVATLPRAFTLPDASGAPCRACVRHSYETDTEIMIYTEVWDGTRWLAWAKGTPDELRRYARPLAELKAADAMLARSRRNAERREREAERRAEQAMGDRYEGTQD